MQNRIRLQFAWSLRTRLKVVGCFRESRRNIAYPAPKARPDIAWGATPSIGFPRCQAPVGATGDEEQPSPLRGWRKDTGTLGVAPQAISGRAFGAGVRFTPAASGNRDLPSSKPVVSEWSTPAAMPKSPCCGPELRGSASDHNPKTGSNLLNVFLLHGTSTAGQKSCPNSSEQSWFLARRDDAGIPGVFRVVAAHQCWLICVGNPSRVLPGELRGVKGSA